jgi:hypothetical protein
MDARSAARRLLSVAAVIGSVVGVQVSGSAPTAGADPGVAAPPPAPVEVTGVRVYSSSSPGGFNSTSTRSATASCPQGQRVLGGGAYVMARNGGSTYGNVLLQALMPGTSSYFAQAVEKRSFGGYSGDWALSAYAICAPVPASLDVEVVSRTSYNSVKCTSTYSCVNDISAPCPAGKRIIGTGGILAGNAFNSGGVSFQQIRPNQQGAYSFVQGVLEGGLAGTTFTVTAFAVCAYPIQGWHVVIDGTDYSNARLQIASVECPEGEQIIGGGLTKGDGLGYARVETMWPLGSPFQKLYVKGGIPDPYGTYDWNLAAWAVCVDL